LEQVQKPVLAPYRKYVEEAYQQIVPLAKKFLPSMSEVNLDDQIKSVKEWLSSNPPLAKGGLSEGSSVAPSSRPVVTRSTSQ